ncbi:hypothetical protein VULLAG_LOCUS17436 [Vulpes lagopus]
MRRVTYWVIGLRRCRQSPEAPSRRTLDYANALWRASKYTLPTD